MFEERERSSFTCLIAKRVLGVERVGIPQRFDVFEREGLFEYAVHLALVHSYNCVPRGGTLH